MSEQQPAAGERADWDAVVVGAGLGGLTTAAYLAAAGRRVLLVEQHDIAGGNSHVFRRRRRFEFDVGVHYLGDCGADGIIPAILGGLGARDRVAFRELDPDCFDRILLPGGVAVDVPASWARYRERLHAALPDDRAGLDTFVDVIEAMGEEQRSTMLAPPDASVPDLVAATPTVQAWGKKRLAELFDHCALSPSARTVLAAQSPNYGMGPAQASVSMHAIVTDHYIRGAYFPVGGGQVLAATLVEVLEANGGELRTRSTVEQILVDGSAVRGVRLDDGSTHTAPLVVSNADYRRTMLELVGEQHLSKATVRVTREAEMGLPFATVYVALDRELTEPEANIWWYGTDDIDEYYRRLAAGEQPQDIEFLFVSFGSLKDPGSRHICPPGHSNFQLMTLCPPSYRPWGVDAGPADGVKYRREPAYMAEKERFTEAMLTAAERVLGPFREHIVHLELASPLSQERYTRSTGGTPFGLARWGKGGTRPNVRTGISGLYVVGQSTRYGSGITGVMVGGLACAGQILDRPALMHEVHGGAVVGDPALLPARPSGWDPVVVSRGVARRSARGLARVE